MKPDLDDHDWLIFLLKDLSTYAKHSNLRLVDSHILHALDDLNADILANRQRQLHPKECAELAVRGVPPSNRLAGNFESQPSQSIAMDRHNSPSDLPRIVPFPVRHSFARPIE